jgi:hypothetical protein
MHLSLIGMSGIGKTYWSTKLETIGYERYSCDEIIARRLDKTLKGVDGSTIELGDWMGRPSTEGYRGREASYLEHEARTLEEALDHVESMRAQKDLVIDTTGSVVYLPLPLIARLRKSTVVVYLMTSYEALDRVYQEFLVLKRPVVWSGMYAPRPGESESGALARCYIALLRQRQELYAGMADVVLGYEQVHSRELGPEGFLRLVEER